MGLCQIAEGRMVNHEANNNAGRPCESGTRPMIRTNAIMAGLQRDLGNRETQLA